MPAVNQSVRAVFGALLALALAAHAALAAPSGPPVRIGSTLALTGPLAATGLVHKIVGELYVEQLNRKNGLLGRPVEWVLKDDQSRPDLARTLKVGPRLVVLEHPFHRAAEQAVFPVELLDVELAH